MWKPLMAIISLALIPPYLLFILLYTLFLWCPYVVHNKLRTQLDIRRAKQSAALWQTPPDVRGMWTTWCTGMLLFVLVYPLHRYLGIFRSKKL